MDKSRLSAEATRVRFKFQLILKTLFFVIFAFQFEEVDIFHIHFSVWWLKPALRWVKLKRGSPVSPAIPWVPWTVRMERGRLATRASRKATGPEVQNCGSMFCNPISYWRFDFIFKIVLIGDAVSEFVSKVIFKSCARLQASGKTSLMRRYVDDTFNHATLTTIGVDFTVKTLVVNGSTVKLQIW